MRERIMGGALLTVIALGLAWWLGAFGGGQYSADPKVAELERLRDESIARQPELDESARRAERNNFREQMQGLTPEQRQAFWESSAPVIIPMMAAAFEKRYDEFMALSPDEQRKKLDEEIDRVEARGGADQESRPGGPLASMDPKQVDAFRKKMLDWTTPEQRAKFHNGIRMFNDRRKQRGLPPIKPPGV